MKKFLTTTLLLSLALTACDTQPVVVEPVEDVPVEAEVETYTWMKHGISFEVPERLMVSDHMYVDALFLDETDLSAIEGDVSGEISIRPYDGMTLEEVVAQYSTNEDFAQEEVEIGENSYTKISYYAEFGGYDAVSYLIEVNSLVFSVSKSATGNDADMQMVLESLEF